MKHTRHAKKDHQCDICNAMIQKSTVYVFETVGPWTPGITRDDEIWTFKAHKTCRDIFDQYCNEYADERGNVMPSASDWLDFLKESHFEAFERVTKTQNTTSRDGRTQVN